jgi:hypothetical protein
VVPRDFLEDPSDDAVLVRDAAVLDAALAAIVR